MEKKSGSKAIIIVLLVLLVLGGAGGGVYYFYQKQAPFRKLGELGYNEQQITVIKNKDLTDKVIETGESELFRYALDQTINNADRYEYFLISDKDLPKMSVKDLYSVTSRMIELGYTAEDAAILTSKLDLDTITTLLRGEQPRDLELFADAIDHGFSITDSLLLASGNRELAEKIFNGDIAYERISPLMEKQYTSDEILTLLNNLSEDDYTFVMGMKYIPELPELSGKEYFDMDLLPRYLMSLRSNRASMDDVVNWVNNDNDYIPADEIDYSAMYHDEEILADYTSYTYCVNKQYALPSSYEPSDLEYLPSGYYVLYHPMRHVAANAFVNMSDGSVVAGYERILAQSNYRSYDHQKSLYDEYVAQDGVALADTYSARPGHSEHQTGLVTDIGTASMDMLYFESYSGYDWVCENAHLYGFIQRYPEGKEYITGYEYESWHFRYVGVETATVIYERGWTLDEYALLFN